jgi:DNA-binding XRE family transcriptional regulator
MPSQTRPSRDDDLRRLREVRDEALQHARRAQELAVERRELMRALIADGMTQADLARELGVSRQAIQKMLQVGTRG